MSQHTPGPWTTNGHAIEQDKAKDALVIVYCEDEQNDDWQANARLIAKAPEMLRLIQDFTALQRGQTDSALRAEGRAEAKLTILEVDNRHQKEYILQLILERDALRAEEQRLRQAMKETVRHEGG